MKIAPFLPVFAVGVALAAGSVTAQQSIPPLKVLVVDMTEVFNSHPQTVERNKAFEAEQAEASAQLSALQAQINDLAEQYRALDEETKNPLLSADAKNQKQAQMQKLLSDANAKNTQGVNYRNQVEQQLNQRIQSFRSLLLEEISKVAAEVGKTHGATLVLDKAGMTASGLAVIYSDPSYDITDEVIAEIAKENPPAETTTAPAAGATAPAAGATPPTSGAAAPSTGAQMPPASTVPAPAAPANQTPAQTAPKAP